MVKYNVTLCYYGRGGNEPEYNQSTIVVEVAAQHNEKVHAQWRAAELLGIQQYYASWSTKLK